MNQTVFTRRQFLKTAAAGSAAVGLGGIGFPNIALAKTALTIGHMPILDHLTLAVTHARDGGNFKQVELNTKAFKSWAEIGGALKAGAVDGAFLLSNLAMDMFSNGMDTRAVVVGHRHGSAITIRKELPLAAAADLKGKTIAIPAKISTHAALLSHYLESAGLKLQDVNVKEIAPPNMLNALKGGSIDGYIVAEPFCAKAEVDGAGKVMVLSKTILPDHICCILVLNNKVIASNPDAVQELVTALIRNGQFIEEDKKQNGGKTVSAIGAKYLNQDEPSILVALTQPTDRITYGNLNPAKADFQKIMDISVKAGLIKGVDLNTFVVPTFFDNAAKG